MRTRLFLAVIAALCGGCLHAVELGIAGSRFTFDKKPVFLFGISYYAGLGAPREAAAGDLEEIQRLGFNWIRVWATWNAWGKDVGAVDDHGRPRQPYLEALQWLVAECDRRGMVVDVTLHRTETRLAAIEDHERAVATVIGALAGHRNWYLDLANERNIRDARHVPTAEIRRLRDYARRLRPGLLVTASHGGEIQRPQVKEYLVDAGVDFLCPHGRREAGSPQATAAYARQLAAWIREDAGLAAPVHFQEPFRRDFRPERWQPQAADFAADVQGALEGGAAGWCFHNGDDRRDTARPRRSLDLTEWRLFDQLDEEELAALEGLRRVFQQAGPARPPTRDLLFFLRRLRTLDHLPELERSHTAMASTWDRTGGNGDGTDFKQVEGGRNVLLDVEGPGCIHRIFTGRLGERIAGTRIQIYLDRKPEPVFDMEVNRFFDGQNGPFPYPLVFHKTYPGMLFPIPFARHCRVQLVSEEAIKDKRRWGNYWQVTYTTYPRGTPVETLAWPPGKAAVRQMELVRRTWLEAESRQPPEPGRWIPARRLALGAGGEGEIRLDGLGLIRELRVSAEPSTPAVWRGLRLQIAWDGAAFPSVDVPLGYLFGNADSAGRPEAAFASLPLGAAGNEAWCRFPMPFAGGAALRFVNGSAAPAHLAVRLDLERPSAVPPHWGRFHATWTESEAGGAASALPRFGKRQAPGHVALERAAGPGKYVGALLHVGWPYPSWWGEGDWLIWTDEDAWPPSYHGTGSEEYFNSGWGDFDRKAISGYVAKALPGDVAVYTFHLNDAFQFRQNVRVVDEIWNKPDLRGVWSTTAYWYGLPASPAGSRRNFVSRPAGLP